MYAETQRAHGRHVNIGSPDRSGWSESSVVRTGLGVVFPFLGPRYRALPESTAGPGLVDMPPGAAGPRPGLGIRSITRHVGGSCGIMGFNIVLAVPLFQTEGHQVRGPCLQVCVRASFRGPFTGRRNKRISPPLNRPHPHATPFAKHTRLQL